MTKTNTMKQISIAHDFSPYPAGRFADDGPYPGEVFRDKYLIPALRNFDNVEVDLDGASGYGSSFLEEAFGGLIRKGFTLRDLKDKLIIKTSREVYESRIWKYISAAK